MVYDGIRWTRDEQGTVKRYAHKTVRSILLEAYEQPDDEEGNKERKRLLTWMVQSESDTRIKGMLSQAQALLPFDASEADKSPCLLNCLNGMLDMRTGALLPHDPQQFVTKLAPSEWRGIDFHTTELDTFLRQITCGDADLLGVLRRSAGYSVSGLAQEKYMFLAHGDTDSGKTTFVEAIGEAVGDYAYTVDFRAFLKKRWDTGETPQPSIAELQGRRFAFSSEVSPDSVFDAATMKRATGGDMITARRVHENNVRFRPTHSIWLVCNDLPKIDTSDTAAMERLVVLPFKMDMKRDGITKDKGLQARLRDTPENRSAWLAWLVRGFMEWNQSQSIGRSQTVEQAKAEYKEQANPLKEWLKERCEDDPSAVTPTAILYGDYKVWCELSTEEPVKKQYFGRLMGAFGRYVAVDMDRNGTRGWKGVRLTRYDPTTPDAPNGQDEQDETAGISQNHMPAASGQAQSSPAKRQQAGSPGAERRGKVRAFDFSNAHKRPQTPAEFADIEDPAEVDAIKDPAERVLARVRLLMKQRGVDKLEIGEWGHVKGGSMRQWETLAKNRRRELPEVEQELIALLAVGV